VTSAIAKGNSRAPRVNSPPTPSGGVDTLSSLCCFFTYSASCYFRSLDRSSQHPRSEFRQISFFFQIYKFRKMNLAIFRLRWFWRHLVSPKSIQLTKNRQYKSRFLTENTRILSSCCKFFFIFFIFKSRRSRPMKKRHLPLCQILTGHLRILKI